MVARTVAFCILNRFRLELAKGAKLKIEEGLFIHPTNLKLVPRVRQVGAGPVSLRCLMPSLWWSLFLGALPQQEGGREEGQGGEGRADQGGERGRKTGEEVRACCCRNALDGVVWIQSGRVQGVCRTAR